MAALKSEPKNTPENMVEEPPPILGSWRNLYIAVIVTLLLAIGALRLFSEIYA